MQKNSTASGVKTGWTIGRKNKSEAAMDERGRVEETEGGCWHREEQREAMEGEGALLKTGEKDMMEKNKRKEMRNWARGLLPRVKEKDGGKKHYNYM